MIRTPKHVITVVAGDKEIRGWESYTIEDELTNGIATFSMRVPFSRAAWNALGIDAPVQILVDSTPVLTGFIDDSEQPEDTEVIEITGRNKVGRLADESIPGISFSGLGIHQLVGKAVGQWFDVVTFTNARNRNILRGKGKKARASSEALRLSTSKKTSTQIEPGQTRWAVITQLCEQAGYIAFSSGNGEELIVGAPNYKQEVQYRFFRPAPGSSRAAESTVKSMGIKRSSGDRYSRIICVGSGQGTDVNYGAKVSSRYGEARSSVVELVGDFSADKVLIVQRAVKSAAEAREFAEAEMARRDSQALVVTVKAGGHGQVIAGTRTTLFAPDTLAVVEDERTGLLGVYTVVGRTFSSARPGAEETAMTLVPKGSVLSR